MPIVRLPFTDYDLRRRNLNTRIGVLLLLLIPFPVLLYLYHVDPLLILLLSIVPPFALGVLYPTWWRRRHHPNRELMAERRFTMLSLICRPIAFVCGIVAMVAWPVDSAAAHDTAVAAALATGTMLVVPLFFAPKNQGSDQSHVSVGGPPPSANAK